MRIASLAGLLLLSACMQAPAASEPNGPAPDIKADPAQVLVPQGVSFGYRYAFRMPANQIKAVQASHTAGCERLGPSRCRITSARYRVGDDGHVAAVSTLMIDPALARAFGDAAAKTVTAANGILIDSRASGGEATGSGALVGRLKASLAQAQASTAPDQVAKAQRLQTALAAIAEVEQNDTWGNATTPVVVTYSSGNVTPGMGASANQSWEQARDTFLASLGGMAVLMSGVGPWIVLLLILVFILRKIVHASDGDVETVRVEHVETEKLGLLHRLLHRDEVPPPLSETRASDEH